MLVNGFIICVVIAACCLIGDAQVDHPWNEFTDLDDYVNRPDSNYAYQRMAEYRESNSTVYIINMTSQRWMNDNVTSQSIWWHWLYLAIPDNVQYYDSAFLYIHTGSNRNPNSIPGPTDSRVRQSASFAESMRAPAGYLRQIPNQPMVFSESLDPDQIEVTEDATIAFTWRQWIDDTSTLPEFILRFPMVKAIMRAFDTINGFTKGLDARYNIEKFVPAGESKRGWTTWLTGCADRRVVGMVPMVLSVINLRTVLHKHWRTMGGWTFAFGNYYVEGLTADLDHPRTQLLADQVDPYSYRSRMTMPKMLVSGASDEFFQIDDPNYFWDGLVGPKFLMNAPNTGHNLAGQRPGIYSNLASFFINVIEGFTWPQFEWSRQDNTAGRSGTITLTSTTTPINVTAWVARTTNLTEERRDFRLRIVDFDNIDIMENPVTWVEEAVEDRGNGIFYKEYSYPNTGYLVFYLN
ncbi:unnamed protein product, partial [Owenia fusiformis]